MPKQFVLVDVNTNHFNCGHYPDWVVEERDIPAPIVDRKGRPLSFDTREAAEAAAHRKNEASDRAWREYLDG